MTTGRINQVAIPFQSTAPLHLFLPSFGSMLQVVNTAERFHTCGRLGWPPTHCAYDDDIPFLPPLDCVVRPQPPHAPTRRMTQPHIPRTTPSSRAPQDGGVHRDHQKPRFPQAKLEPPAPSPPKWTHFSRSGASRIPLSGRRAMCLKNSAH